MSYCCMSGPVGPRGRRRRHGDPGRAADPSLRAIESGSYRRKPNRTSRMQWFSTPWFRRKPVALLIGEMNDGERLHRRLGPVSLTSLGVGATIGTGLYVLTGVVAHDFAGPSLMLSFLVAAVGCGF